MGSTIRGLAALQASVGDTNTFSGCPTLRKMWSNAKLSTNLIKLAKTSFEKDEKMRVYTQGVGEEGDGRRDGGLDTTIASDMSSGADDSTRKEHAPRSTLLFKDKNDSGNAFSEGTSEDIRANSAGVMLSSSAFPSLRQLRQKYAETWDMLQHVLQAKTSNKPQIEHLRNLLATTATTLRAEESIIAAKISREISPHACDISHMLCATARVDAVCARLRFATALNAVKPVVRDEGVIDVCNARHPVLQLRGVAVVGNDLFVADKGLIVSGPNAAGKTGRRLRGFVSHLSTNV